MVAWEDETRNPRQCWNLASKMKDRNDLPTFDTRILLSVVKGKTKNKKCESDRRFFD